MTDRIDFDDEVMGEDAAEGEESVILDLPDNYNDLSPLEKAHAVKAARKAAGEDTSIERLNPKEKALRKPTPGNCIKAKCYDCMGEGHDVGWKWMIGNCTCKNLCSLYPVRPYKSLEGKPKPNGVL